MTQPTWSAGPLGGLLVLPVVACDAFYGVNGRVTTCSDQRAIPGALLHLQSHGKRGDDVSKADGSYNVLLNDPPGDDPSRLTPFTRTLSCASLI